MKQVEKSLPLLPLLPPAGILIEADDDDLTEIFHNQKCPVPGKDPSIFSDKRTGKGSFHDGNEGGKVHPCSDETYYSGSKSTSYDLFFSGSNP